MAIEQNDECFPEYRNEEGGGSGDPSTGDNTDNNGNSDGNGDNDDINSDDTGLGEDPPERTNFRPINQSNNFISEDKTVKVQTAALSREKYMIYSSHLAVSNFQAFQKRQGTGPWRYPEDVYRVQNELSGFYTSDGLTNTLDERLSDIHVPQLLRQESTLQTYYQGTDPLMYCLGGYYKATQNYADLDLIESGMDIMQDNPKNKSVNNNVIIGDPPAFTRTPTDSHFGQKYFPFITEIEPLTDNDLSSLQNNDYKIFNTTGEKEKITFSFENIDEFNSQALEDNVHRIAPTVGEQALAKYLYGHDLTIRDRTRRARRWLIGGDESTYQENHENLIPQNIATHSGYEYYNFKTDMPFFAKEIEKIGTMKNLIVSTNLESNFISSEYRRYGSGQNEKETQLPSIYTLHTLDKVETLPPAEREEYVNLLNSNINYDTYLKKMLFTAGEVSKFDTINHDYKGKVPLYVEFNIGTNQGSPMAQILTETGLDKLFLQFMSTATLNRASGRTFAEVIAGAGDPNSAGQRTLYITQAAETGTSEETGIVGGTTQVIDFEDWLHLFIPTPRSTITNPSGVTYTREQVQNGLATSGPALADAYATFIGGTFFQNSDRVSLQELVDQSITREATNAATIYDFLNSAASTFKNDFFGLGSSRATQAQEIRSQEELYEAYLEYSRWYSANAGFDSGHFHSQDIGEKQARIRELMSANFDVKSFPLNMKTGVDEINQFRMLLQAIILKGRLMSNYAPFYHKYSEIVKRKNLCYSETLMYRIDKHRATPEGVVDPNPVQSFYMMDSDGVENINFIDSQIIFGQRYIYRVYSYDFVVGTKYIYGEHFHHDLGQISTPTNFTAAQGDAFLLVGSDPGLLSKFYESPNFKAIVNSTPCFKVVEIPYFEREIIVMDRPPMFPEIKFYPLRNDTSKFKISMQATSGERAMVPIVIEPEDQALIDDIRLVQGLESNQKIFYESDDLPTDYQVYRIDTPPLSYRDFSGMMHHSMTETKASAVDFYDYVIPNKKYYYTFRCMDKSINLSNPTIVYQVELVSQEGYSYLEVKPYEFPKASRNFKHNFERVLFIKAAAKQRNFELSPNADLLFDSTEIGNFGNYTPSVFDANKKYKIRIKSKHSQKKIDINVTFEKKIARGEEVNQPFNPAEMQRQSFLSENLDFARMNTLYGDLYFDLMENLTKDIEVGETTERNEDFIRERRRNLTGRPPPNNSTPTPSGGGASGGGSSGGGGMGGGSGGYSPGG